MGRRIGFVPDSPVVAMKPVPPGLSHRVVNVVEGVVEKGDAGLGYPAISLRNLRKVEVW